MESERTVKMGRTRPLGDVRGFLYNLPLSSRRFEWSQDKNLHRGAELGDEPCSIARLTENNNSFGVNVECGLDGGTGNTLSDSHVAISSKDAVPDRLVKTIKIDG